MMLQSELKSMRAAWTVRRLSMGERFIPADS